MSPKQTRWEMLKRAQKDIAEHLALAKGRFSGFMQFTRPRQRLRDVLEDRLDPMERSLKERVLEGDVEGAVEMLMERPQLIAALTRIMSRELVRIPASPNEFYLEATKTMPKCLPEGRDGDIKIQALGRLLEHRDHTARHLAMQILISAASDGGRDILFAVQALERGLEDVSLAKDSAMALAYQYVNRPDAQALARILAHGDPLVRTWGAKAVGAMAVDGKRAAIDALLKGCESGDEEVRRICATELSGALFNGQAEVKAVIRDSVRIHKRSGLVHLDVLREFQKTERLLTERRRGQV